MSKPSNRQSSPIGELPRIIISFRVSFAATTPAKPATMRAGSPTKVPT